MIQKSAIGTPGSLPHSLSGVELFVLLLICSNRLCIILLADSFEVARFLFAWILLLRLTHPTEYARGLLGSIYNVFTFQDSNSCVQVLYAPRHLIQGFLIEVARFFFAWSLLLKPMLPSKHARSLLNAMYSLFAF